MTVTSMTSDTDHLYLIGLGSNQRHGLLGGPADIIRHAISALEMNDIHIFIASNIISSRPVGPSQRKFANAAAILISSLTPPELLSRLKAVEHHMGRRTRGQKWRSRIIDLDIIFWSGGIWSSDSPALIIPHPHMPTRRFVLEPASEIAPFWRDPISGKRLKQLFSQLIRPKRVDP